MLEIVEFTMNFFWGRMGDRGNAEIAQIIEHTRVVRYGISYLGHFQRVIFICGVGRRMQLQMHSLTTG
jgi:hypothetical protein